jgi:hypothetical protein
LPAETYKLINNAKRMGTEARIGAKSENKLAETNSAGGPQRRRRGPQKHIKMHVQLYLSFLSALFFGGPSQRRPPVVAGVRLAVPWFSCEIISAICWPRDCICVPAIVEMLTARRSSKQTDTPTEMHIKTKKDANQHAQRMPNWNQTWKCGTTSKPTCKSNASRHVPRCCLWLRRAPACLVAFLTVLQTGIQSERQMALHI